MPPKRAKYSTQEVVDILFRVPGDGNVSEDPDFSGSEGEFDCVSDNDSHTTVYRR